MAGTGTYRESRIDFGSFGFGNLFSNSGNAGINMPFSEEEQLVNKGLGDEIRNYAFIYDTIQGQALVLADAFEMAINAYDGNELITWVLPIVNTDMQMITQRRHIPHIMMPTEAGVEGVPNTLSYESRNIIFSQGHYIAGFNLSAETNNHKDGNKEMDNYMGLLYNGVLRRMKLNAFSAIMTADNPNHNTTQGRVVVPGSEPGPADIRDWWALVVRDPDNFNQKVGFILDNFRKDNINPNFFLAHEKVLQHLKNVGQTEEERSAYRASHPEVYNPTSGRSMSSRRYMGLKVISVPPTSNVGRTPARDLSLAQYTVGDHYPLYYRFETYAPECPGAKAAKIMIYDETDDLDRPIELLAALENSGRWDEAGNLQLPNNGTDDLDPYDTFAMPMEDAREEQRLCRVWGHMRESYFEETTARLIGEEICKKLGLDDNMRGRLVEAHEIMMRWSDIDAAGHDIIEATTNVALAPPLDAIFVDGESQPEKRAVSTENDGLPALARRLGTVVVQRGKLFTGFGYANFPGVCFLKHAAVIDSEAFAPGLADEATRVYNTLVEFVKRVECVASNSAFLDVSMIHPWYNALPSVDLQHAAAYCCSIFFPSVAPLFYKTRNTAAQPNSEEQYKKQVENFVGEILSQNDSKIVDAIMRIATTTAADHIRVSKGTAYILKNYPDKDQVELSAQLTELFQKLSNIGRTTPESTGVWVKTPLTVHTSKFHLIHTKFSAGNPLYGYQVALHDVTTELLGEGRHEGEEAALRGDADASRMPQVSRRYLQMIAHNPISLREEHLAEMQNNARRSGLEGAASGPRPAARILNVGGVREHAPVETAQYRLLRTVHQAAANYARNKRPLITVLLDGSKDTALNAYFGSLLELVECGNPTVGSCALLFMGLDITMDNICTLFQRDIYALPIGALPARPWGGYKLANVAIGRGGFGTGITTFGNTVMTKGIDPANHRTTVTVAYMNASMVINPNNIKILRAVKPIEALGGCDTRWIDMKRLNSARDSMLHESGRGSLFCVVVPTNYLAKLPVKIDWSRTPSSLNTEETGEYDPTFHRDICMGTDFLLKNVPALRDIFATANHVTFSGRFCHYNTANHQLDLLVESSGVWGKIDGPGAAAIRNGGFVRNSEVDANPGYTRANY